METKIQLLSDKTINQIAAGEVVENPASVVKELVENAIDAGALRITVEIAGGGFQLIRVSDDGSGMGREDARLCLERHATSKIREADDLLSLSSMGFRGEALASIAAIAKLDLLTATAGASGTRVQVEGGHILHVEPCGRARGTTIEVRSLFYNVPARKKFQKSAPASSAEITKVLTLLALAHVEVGFELRQNERILFTLAPQTLEHRLEMLQTRAAELLGAEFLSASYQIEVQEGLCHVQGLVGHPLAARHNRSGQFLFINHRPVQCFPLGFAIRDAYGTRLSSDRHALFILHLSLPAALVDVNVHPQKKEVRLRDEKQLKDNLKMAVQVALERAEGTAMPALAAPVFLAEERGARPFSLDFTGQVERATFRPLELKDQQWADEWHAIGLYAHYLMVTSHALFPGKDGMVFVDLQAAEARILLERLLTAQRDAALSQHLLFPLTLSFAKAEMQLLETAQSELHQLGFELRAIGPNAMIIEAIPPFLEEHQVAEAFGDFLDLLHGDETSDERLKRLAARLSRVCRSRKKSYSVEEGKELVRALLKTQSPFHCPQGRATLYHMSKEELEKQFSTPKVL